MSGSTRFSLLLHCLLASSIAASSLAAQSVDPRSRVSVASNGAEGNGASTYASISRDGRWVAFVSNADDLVPGDVEGHADVFVHDRWTGVTVRVSIDSNGVAADQDSLSPSLSGDGRFVAFESFADNLIAVDHNQQLDVFVHDRDPDRNGIFDEGNGVTTRISQRPGAGGGDGASSAPSISADGNFVAFASYATNFANGDTNGCADIFVRDRSTGTMTRVSVDSSGVQANGDSFAPSISGDGLFVAFQSRASDLVAGDTNGCDDVFVRDLVAGTTACASVDAIGVEGNLASDRPQVSGDGSRIVFQSQADNFSAIDRKGGSTDVFLRDLVAGTIEVVSVDSSGVAANDASFLPWISDDGLTVAFMSSATNLSPNDTDGTYDVFVRDTVAGTTAIVSQTAWLQSTEALGAPLSADGRLVVFWSDSANLAAADGNGVSDVFVYDRSVAEPVAASASYGAGYPGTNGVPGLAASNAPVFGAMTTLTIGNSSGAWAPALVALGVGRASIPTRAGGTLLVDASSFVVEAIPPSGASIPYAVPFDPALCDLTLDLQALELDPGAAFGIAFTPGLEWTFGN